MSEVNVSSTNTPFDGEKLRQLRRSAGLTQEQLAHELCLTRETIGHIENNKPSALRGLTVDLLTKWAVVCHEHVDASQKYVFISYFTDYLKSKLGL
jgi:transcriptional regulator with XRE-family HTH domain